MDEATKKVLVAFIQSMTKAASREPHAIARETMKATAYHLEQAMLTVMSEDDLKSIAATIKEGNH